MGYTTEFEGSFTVTPALKPEHAEYLRAFSETRRMKRDSVLCERMPDPIREAAGLASVGPEGRYFVGGLGVMGQDLDPSVVDANEPPSGQPGLWCKWEPRDEGYEIGWSGGEKFYDYTEWLVYIIEHFLGPWGYSLNDEVAYQGENPGYFGKILVSKNVVSVSRGKRSYGKPEVVGSTGR